MIGLGESRVTRPREKDVFGTDQPAWMAPLIVESRMLFRFLLASRMNLEFVRFVGRGRRGPSSGQSAIVLLDKANKLTITFFRRIIILNLCQCYDS